MVCGGFIFSIIQQKMLAFNFFLMTSPKGNFFLLVTQSKYARHPLSLPIATFIIKEKKLYAHNREQKGWEIAARCAQKIEMNWIMKTWNKKFFLPPFHHANLFGRKAEDKKLVDNGFLLDLRNVLAAIWKLFCENSIRREITENY